MKLTIHNKLVILFKKLYYYLLLNLYGLLLCIFYIYYALATYIIYYYYLFISKLAIGNWKLPSLKNLSPQLLFFFYSFFFFSGKGWSWLIALLFQIFTIQSKLLHFGVLSKPANNRFNHTGIWFLWLNRQVLGYFLLLDDFQFLVIIGLD